MAEARGRGVDLRRREEESEHTGLCVSLLSIYAATDLQVLLH